MIVKALSILVSPADSSVADRPSQTGRIYLVTGGTRGIGYETAKALAAAGAEVMAGIRRSSVGAQVRFEAPAVPSENL